MSVSYETKLNGSYVFFGIFLIIYQILGSIFVYLPLLYGLIFCYMFYLLEEKERLFNKFDFRWYFSLFFLFFTDVSYGFFVFSSWFAFFIFYYICADWIKTNLKVGKFMPIIFVLFSYLFIFILDFTLSFLSDEKITFFSFSFFVSIILECFLAYVFFKDKI